MSKETIDKATTVVVNRETMFRNSLQKYYKETQDRVMAGEIEEESKLDNLLRMIEKEEWRLNPKDKYDEEEVAISRIVK